MTERGALERPVGAFAADEAERWKRGLAEWGEDGARIGRLRDAADFTIYTPGSTAGVPVSVLRSFAPPDGDDPEMTRDAAQATASGVLTLVGIDADPLKSREHILLSTILLAAWRANESLDLAALVQRVQTPPMTRVGVIDVDSIFPPKDRFALAMALNTLLASPGFDTWTTAIRSTSARSCTRRPASRACRSSRSRISTIRSACSSSRCS